MALGVEALKAYLACAAIRVAALDDGVSSAETVALALRSACQVGIDAAGSVLRTDSGVSGYLDQQLKPKLIEIVLSHRAARRQNRDPPKEKKSGTINTL